MGLTLSLYRDDYDDRGANVFHGKHRITLVNADGPAQPTDDAPAAELVLGPIGNPVIVPVNQPADMLGPMAGGTFAASSDSRFGAAIKAVTGLRLYAALPVHDRFETSAQYEALSR